MCAALLQVATLDSATQGPGPRWNAFQYSRYWRYKEREATWGALGGCGARSQALTAEQLRAAAEEADEADSRQLPTGRAFQGPVKAFSGLERDFKGPCWPQQRHAFGRACKGTYRHQGRYVPVYLPSQCCNAPAGSFSSYIKMHSSPRW